MSVFRPSASARRSPLDPLGWATVRQPPALTPWPRWRAIWHRCCSPPPMPCCLPCIPCAGLQMAGLALTESCSMVICGLSVPVRDLRRAVCVQQREGGGQRGGACAWGRGRCNAARLTGAGAAGARCVVWAARCQEQSPGEDCSWTKCSCARIGFSYLRPQGPMPRLPVKTVCSDGAWPHWQ